MQPHDDQLGGTVAQASRPPPEKEASAPPPSDGRAAGRAGRRIRRFAIGLMFILAAGFLLRYSIRLHHDHRLATEALAVSSAPPQVVVATVGPAPAGQPLVLPGETAAWYASTIYARVNGYVRIWWSDIGDHVKRGQVLAAIETPELDAALVAAKAKLRSANATVRMREAEAAFAETTYARWRNAPKGVVSEQEREDKKAQYASAQARLAAARAQVNADEAEVERLNSFQVFKQVTAPYSGTITQRRIDIGDLVSAGSSAQTTPLYRMSKANPIRIFVEAPQSVQADLMKVGIPAVITAHDLAGRKFTGKITRTSEAISPQARTFRVEIDIPNPDLALVPGMYVEVAFQLANEGAVEVPAAALVFRSRSPEVAIVGADGSVHFVPVTIRRDYGNVVDLGSGVSVGAKVVLNISNQIVDGEQVKVVPQQQQPAAGSIAEPAR